MRFLILFIAMVVANADCAIHPYGIVYGEAFFRLYG